MQILKYQEEYQSALEAFNEACRLDPESEPSQQQKQQLEELLLGVNSTVHAPVRRGCRSL